MKRALTMACIAGISIIILLVITGIASHDRIAIPDGFAGSYLELDGDRIRYVQKGAGRDVLLIHGLPGSIEDWDPVIDRLAKKYRVTAYDRPGFGFSSDNAPAHTVAANADTAARIMRRLNLRNVVVVGHSYGGGIALALAARKIEDIRGYVSLAGVSHPSENVMFIFYLNRLPLVGRGLAAAGTALLGDSMMEEMVRMAFTPDMNILTPDYLNKRKEMMFQTKVVMSLSAEDVRYNNNMRELLPSYPGIAARFMILHGDGDLMVPVEDSRQLVRALPNAVLKELPGTGHMVQFKYPEKVIAAVDAMFAQ